MDFAKMVEVAKDMRGDWEIGEYRRQLLLKAIQEKMQRKREATCLYEPLPVQEAFHRSQAPERLLRGSNRGGKTLPAAMELAWVVANRHPYSRFPKSGRAFCVGKSEEHIANVLWHKLSRKQPNFRMIRDDVTDEWRAYRPWADSARYDESRPMDPLIPQRLIKRISWKKRGLGVPNRVELKTGWEIQFFTGLGKPPQGSDVDYCWFDEEIPDSQWYTEMAARLLDRQGRFVWSATAQAGGDQLWNLHLRYEAEAGKDEPAVEEFGIYLDDNPHITEKAKNQLKEKYAHDPDAYRVRIQGEYLITSFRIYPAWNDTTHIAGHFEIPKNWCRYMVVDPGHVICAVLFIAVPPCGKRFVAYDELYLQDCDPSKFGDEVRRKAEGLRFQSFIIDDAGSRRTEAASGTTIRQVYSEQLYRNRVRSFDTGYSFELGLSNVHSGLAKVREWLGKSPECSCDDCKLIDKAPAFVVMDGMAPNFVNEIKRYHRKRVGGLLREEPEQKNNHLMDAVRYAAMHGCRYVSPTNGPHGRASRYLNSKRKRHKKKPRGVYLAAGNKED